MLTCNSSTGFKNNDKKLTEEIECKVKLLSGRGKEASLIYANIFQFFSNIDKKDL